MSEFSIKLELPADRQLPLLEEEYEGLRARLDNLGKYLHNQRGADALAQDTLLAKKQYTSMMEYACILAQRIRNLRDFLGVLHG